MVDSLDYRCKCDAQLEVAKELRSELERGDEVLLYCRECLCFTFAKRREISERAPYRLPVPWTESFY